MERLDAEHEAVIRGIVQEKANRLEEMLYGIADPSSALQTLSKLFEAQIQLEQEKIPLTLKPEQELDVINRIENWYNERGLKHPNPKWAEEQKRFWKKKIK